MQPVVRLSFYLSLLAVGSATASLRAKPAPADPSRLVYGDAGNLPASECPPGTLPDAGVCIPVPSTEDGDGLALLAERNSHHTRHGPIEYDQIPRQPDRPKDYRLYRYPIEPIAGQSLLMSGYDLHLPDASQRRGAKLKATGHGGIDLAQRRGAEVHLVYLEHQLDEAEVLHNGWLFGNSVVTLHHVRQAGERRDYLVIHGHLERAASGLATGDLLDEGSLLGFVGDSDSPGAVHLHLEIRQVRGGVEARSLTPGEIVDNARTVACDPRNLLPLLDPQ